jgi:hypothetical protein
MGDGIVKKNTTTIPASGRSGFFSLARQEGSEKKGKPTPQRDFMEPKMAMRTTI